MKRLRAQQQRAAAAAARTAHTLSKRNEYTISVARFITHSNASFRPLVRL